MDAWQPLDRRTFLADMGKGAFALAVVGLAACGPGTVASSAPTRASGEAAGSSRSPGSGGPTGATATGSSDPPAAPDDAVTWERVNLGFVSAYVLVRGDEAAIVDTGVAGSADEIEASLTKVGLDWSAVGAPDPDPPPRRPRRAARPTSSTARPTPLATPARRTSRRSACRGR